MRPRDHDLPAPVPLARLVLLGILLLNSPGAAVAGDALAVISGPTMGTGYTVKFYAGAASADAERIQSQIDSLLERINDQMSTWRAESELSRFNKSASTTWFSVSPELAYVVESAGVISAMSDGAFDVTVGPVVNLWGFGPDRGAARLPTSQQIREAMERVDYRRLLVRSTPSALRKLRPDIYVDLSAIAKGFAVDEIARLLDERRIPSYLVEIGGELRARGVKGDGSSWNVAIERPLSGERTIQDVVALRDASIATSGDYRNYVVQDGKRFSHTIDPHTGRPITHGLASVSVIADLAMRADALATAIMVMGPEQGYELAMRETLAAQLIVRSEDGLRVMATPRFERYLQH